MVNPALTATYMMLLLLLLTLMLLLLFCRPTDSSGNGGDADCWLLNTKSQY